MNAFSNLVCDLDGVVYLGDVEVPGAGAALTSLDADVRIVFATNNSTTTPAGVAARITRLTGYRADAGQVVTSSMAAADLLEGAASTVLVVGEEGIVDALGALSIGVTDDPTMADAVVVGLDRSVTYDHIRLAATAVLAGRRFVATNTDATYPTPDGPWPGGGAIVAAIERATGVTAEVAGKPHEPMVAAIERRLGGGPTAVVGDRPETDLALAAVAGWHAILALSGVTTDPSDVPDDLRPAQIITSLADLAR